MKTKFITTLFVLTAYFCFGQTSDKNSTNNISLGLIFSPDYCFRALNSETSIQSIADYRDSTEIPKFGFTTGFSLLIKPWNRFSIETGLQYSDKGEKTIVMEFEPVVSDPALLTNQVRFSHHYCYLDIPIKANYLILKGKINLIVTAGFSTNIYLYQRTKVSFIGFDETNSSSNSEDLSRLNVAVLLGGGIDYNINQRLKLRVEPIFRYSIMPIVDAPIKQNQYSIGVNFGLYYQLK